MIDTLVLVAVSTLDLVVVFIRVQVAELILVPAAACIPALEVDYIPDQAADYTQGLVAGFIPALVVAYTPDQAAGYTLGQEAACILAQEVGSTQARLTLLIVEFGRHCTFSLSILSALTLPMHLRF